MDLSFFPLTLEALDHAAGEALCLFVGEDERPLTGLAGLADWRLAGGLSRLLRAGMVKGLAGESVLTLGQRLGFSKLFLFGLGPVQEQSEEQLAQRLAEGMRKLGQAGVEVAAFQLPSRMSPDAGIRTLIDEPSGPLRALVFGADPAVLVRALSHAASRGPADAKLERRVVKVPGPPAPQPVAQKPVKRPPVEIPRPSPLPFAPVRVPSKPGVVPPAAPLVTSEPPPAAAPQVPAPAEPPQAPPPHAIAPVTPSSPEVKKVVPANYVPPRYVPPPEKPKGKKKRR